MIQWVWQNRKRAGATTQNFPKAKRLYLAIRTGQQVFGVVGIPMEKQTQPDAFTSSVLFSILGECALALESLRNAEEKDNQQPHAVMRGGNRSCPYSYGCIPHVVT